MKRHQLGRADYFENGTIFWIVVIVCAGFALFDIFFK